MQPEITLISRTEKPLEAMTFAAKVCYGYEDKKLTKDKKERLLKKFILQYERCSIPINLPVDPAR